MAADLRALANQYAEQYGVDPAVFAALVQQESGWNPNARNEGSGAYGLTQAMPATARDPGFGVAPLTDTSDPGEQLRFGAEYFSKMLERYDGNVEKALAAYNWGPGNADKWSGDRSQLPAETSHYIATITGNAGAGAGGGGEGLSQEPQAMAQDSAGLPQEEQEPFTPPTQTGLGGLMPSREYEDPNTGEKSTIYADHMLGDLARKRDAFNKRWGLGQNPAAGQAMHQLGMEMMTGGFG
jgi:hypothetical protein